MILHPYRSVLYIPGDRARAMDKVRGLPADAIIFDLEDAVAIDAKEGARDLLCSELKTGGYGKRAQIVRINGLDTSWWKDDVGALSSANPQAILLPKVSSAADIATLTAQMDQYPGFADTTIWAMMETPIGILNAVEIANAPRMAGFVMGTNDLAAELNSINDPTRLAMQTSLGHCLLAAKAAGIAIVDGVYNAFKDEDGLRVEATQGRTMGFDGKTLIHPAQLVIANEVFAPSQADLELAQRHIDAFKAASDAGQGVAVVDGKIVENLHVKTAEANLAIAAVIAELEG